MANGADGPPIVLADGSEFPPDGASSGLLVPKGPGFEVRLHGHEGIDAFPGHQDDAVCLSADGSAVYFDGFIGR